MLATILFAGKLQYSTFVSVSGPLQNMERREGIYLGDVTVPLLKSGINLSRINGELTSVIDL